MIAKVIITPPIIVLLLGTSLIPNKGSQTQKIPPNISVSDRRVRSAAGRYFDFAEYKISAEQTINPCSEESEVFFKVIKILLSLKIKTNKETLAANNPAIDTVVSFGVFFLYLRVTVNIANPKEDINPLTRPNSVPVWILSKHINIIPAAAIVMAIKVVLDIFSFKTT